MAASVLDRNDFWLRRIHSLLGVLPLTLFMAEHMFTNMKATQGPEPFHNAVDFLTSLPALFLIEFAFILLPLYFHGLFGAYIYLTGRSNVKQYGYAAAWRWWFQRVTGLFVLFFVTVHLLSMRFGVVFPWEGGHWGIEHLNTVTGGDDSFYSELHEHFRQPGFFIFYLLGLAATFYHLGNGLWTFAITWGVTRTRSAQKYFGYVCALIGFALFGAGLFSMYGFVKGEPVGCIQKIKPAHHATGGAEAVESPEVN